MSRRESLTLLGVLAILIAAALFAEFQLDLSPGLALVDGKLSETQQKAIEIELDLCKTFIGWAIGVIGALAVLFKLNIEEKLKYSRADVIYASFIVVLGVVSIFFGHLGMDLSERALSSDLYPLTDPAVHWTLRLQYLAALIQIAFFGAFALRYFFHKAKP